MSEEFMQSEAEKQENKSYLKLGCGIFMVLSLLVGVILYVNARNIMAFGMEKSIAMMLEQTPLPEGEQEELMEPIKGLINDYRDEKYNDAQLKAILEDLAQSKVAALVGLRFFEWQHIEKAELPEEEKTSASLTLSRYRQAILTAGPELEARYDELWALLNIPKEDNQVDFKKTLSEEDMNASLLIMSEVADKQEMPKDEYIAVNLAEYMTEVLTKAKAKLELPLP